MSVDKAGKHDYVLMVFAKAPVPGEVKTRLGQGIGMRGAARIYRQMLFTLLEKLTQDADINIQLWCSPDTRHPFFRKCARELSVELKRQQGDDLGQRMLHAFRVNRAYRYMLLIGADIPGINITVIGQTISMMRRGADVVLLPTVDGGYGLIAMSRPYPHLFTNMRWSTGMVLSQTLSRAKRQRLLYLLLDSLPDIDTKSDYIKYMYRQDLLS